MLRKSIYDIEWKYYDLLYGDLSEDIDFYRRFVKGKSLLEIMCGTGRIISSLKNLEERYGLDIDERMLSIMRSKDKKIVAIKADAREFSIKKKFDNIIIGLNSILMFNSDDKIKLLQNAKKHLNKDGKIFVDAIMPPDLEEGVVYLGDYKIRGETEIYRYFVPYFSPDMRILHLRYIYDIFEMGEYRRETAMLLLYPENYQEMKEIANKSGLKIKNVYGGYDCKRFNSSKSERMLLVLKKVEEDE